MHELNKEAFGTTPKKAIQKKDDFLGGSIVKAFFFIWQ